MEITSHDALLIITRYRNTASLLLDRQALTGVRGFTFDVITGTGEIAWWKDDPADYDRAELLYGGTIRAASTVILIVRSFRT